MLISPEGPLHLMPFGALTRRVGGQTQYLVEWKPIHIVVSATVYAELKKGRRNVTTEASLVAFGDPKYPTVSKERAKSVGKGPRYVHFACHGLVDERLALNSALALTVPEAPGEREDNGLLQAWEIFERVRLDADLVTLSACETGLGKESGGEGFVGLTRAFQFAGARTVAASLWGVADESTARLMRGFYAQLQRGRTKDEALRTAQLEMIRDRRYAHPFHWAPFQLYGDWR